MLQSRRNRVAASARTDAACPDDDNDHGRISIMDFDTDAQSWQRAPRWRRRRQCRRCLLSRPGQAGGATSFYEKGNVRIRYQETGSGFPLLVTPGGGLNSRISNWPNAVFNAMEVFKNDFRCITMDQRNAERRRIHWPDPGRRPVGRLRRRPVGADGPPRHPPVLLHGLLHRRPVCAQADGAGAGARRRGRAVPAGRAPAGEPGRDVQFRP